MNNKPHPTQVTLHDVARLAGVSSKTVSRVVNNEAGISNPTRQRVQAAIQELRYRPNMLARSLVSRRSHTLAVVAWGIEYYGPLRVLIGIEKQADELGYSLLLNLLSQPAEGNVHSVLNDLVARRVDGIIWAVPEIGDNRAWLQSELLENLPPVVFLSMEPRPGLPVIAIDNRSGAAQATQHLLDQDRRTIGLITGPMNWWESRERYAGWKETLERSGLTASLSLIVEGDWYAPSGERAMRTLLARRPDIDALFACNDQMALGAMRVAQQQGRRTPKDIAIIGFDDIPEAAYFWPPLSSVKQQLGDVGQSAVQVLHRLIEAGPENDDGREPAATILKPELVVRESSLCNFSSSANVDAISPTRPTKAMEHLGKDGLVSENAP